MRAAAPSLRSPLPSDEELRVDNFGKQGSLGLAQGGYPSPQRLGPPPWLLGLRALYQLIAQLVEVDRLV